MKIDKAKMVGWFSPLQLLRTGWEVAISTIFGKHADNRLLEAALNPNPKDLYYDLSNPENNSGDFWIDYVSDVGDGWNSTYTVAYYLSQPTLKLDAEETKRGNLLVFGGDEIYPTAKTESYKQKLVKPYQTAFPDKAVINSPIVFAIPGNHDWYDSLTSFKQIFCRKQPFAGWQTIQERSYFAVSLPHHWWLFGTDIQLSSLMDEPQLEYFKQVMKVVKKDPQARIILCNAEPYWIYSKVNENDNGNTQKAMEIFQGRILEGRVALYLAGDLHHYRRHENSLKKKHKIISGGGGAFLHPTHRQNVEKIGKNSIYDLKESFPDEVVSRQLCWQNLWFCWKNPWFGLVTGFLYLFTAIAFGLPSGDGFWTDLKITLVHTFTRDFALIWVLINLIGLFYFTDKNTKFYQRILTTIVHALFHFASLFTISWLFLKIFNGSSGGDSVNNYLLFKLMVLIFMGGYLVGSTLLGIYLLVTLNLFGWNQNEAFASLSIEDYKNFLRLKITEDELTIYPVGISKVSRNWKPGENGKSKLEPDDKKASLPQLIEEPIRIKRDEVLSEDPNKFSASEKKEEERIQALKKHEKKIEF